MTFGLYSMFFTLPYVKHILTLSLLVVESGGPQGQFLCETLM